MGTGMKSFLSAGLLLSVLLSAQGQTVDLIDSAKKLYEAKKYSECAELLKKEATRPNASLELLKIAMAANLQSGNPLSASVIGGEYLKRAKSPTVNDLYIAAEAARLSGDEKTALSRFHAFCMKAGAEKDKRFKAAAQYLINRGNYPDVFMKYAKQEDPALTCWKAKEIGKWLVETGNSPVLANYIPFVAETYTDNTDVINTLIDQIYSSQSRFPSGLTEVADAISVSKFPEKNVNWDLLGRLLRDGVSKMDKTQKFRTVRRFIENNGVNHSRLAELYCDAGITYIYSFKTPEEKTAAAREFFVNYKKFAESRDAGAVQTFMNRMSTADRKEFSFVKPAMLADVTNNLYKLKNKDYADPDYEVFRVINFVADRFYKDSKRDAVAYLKAVMPSMNFENARKLFSLDVAGSRVDSDKNNIRVFLASGKDATPFEEMRRCMNIMTALRENKFRKKFAAAMTNQIALNLYDVNYIVSELSGTGVKAADAVQMVLAGGKLAGTNPKFKILVQSMERTGTLKDAAGFAELKKFAENGKGSDPVLSAAGQFFTSDKSGKDAQELLSNFLKVYKGTVPSVEKYSSSATQIKSLQEAAAYHVLRLALQNANDRDFASFLVKNFGPRMQYPGELFASLLWRAQWLDGDKGAMDGHYYKLAQKAAPIYAKADAYLPEMGFLLRPINPKGKHLSVLAPFYERNPWESLDYLLRNASAWDAKFFYKELEDLMKKGGHKLSDHYLNGLRSILDKNFVHYKDVPVSILKMYLDVCDKKGTAEKRYICGHEYEIIVNAPEKLRLEVLEHYSNILLKRSAAHITGSISGLEWTICNRISHQDGARFLEKLYGKVSADGYFKNEGATVPANAVWVLGRIHEDKNAPEAMKSRADGIRNEIRNAIYSGKTLLTGDRPGLARFMASGLKDYLKTRTSPLTVSRAVNSVAEALMPETHTWRGKEAAENAWKVVSKIPYPQVQYAFLTSFTSGSGGFQQEMKNTYMMQISELAKDIPGMIPVEKNDPAYNLYLALNLRREGNALQAWALAREKITVLAQRWKELDYDFVLWVLDMARTQKMYKEAVELSSTLWLDEGKLTPEYAARLALIKGDIYRDQKNYPIARLEYESLRNSPRCGKTPSGRMAKFRLVELLILTQDYSAARTMLEQLVDSAELEDQAEAYFLLAKLEYSNNEYEATLENLNEVFQRLHNHVEGRLLEATVKLKLGRISDDEIAVGTEKLATIQVPGRNLELLINDQNLGVIRGGKALPVLITTSKGKDREVVQLMPGATDMNKFAASVPTKLGKAVPNNGILELCGDDLIEYMIEPEFQKANGITREANQKVIRYAAQLTASSQPIMADMEQGDLQFQQEMLRASGRSVSLGREKTVRPGNPIYIRVKDFAMSRNTDKPDTVKVDLVCDSGDELHSFVLTETGNTTGIFEGKVLTGIPFPNVNVSSSPEGQDVNAVINSTKNGSWTSNPSNRTRPQWIEVDTMTSTQLNTIQMDMVNPDSVKNLKLYASLDGSNELLCTYPEAQTEKIRGGMRMYTADSRGGQNTHSAIAGRFTKLGESAALRNPVAYRSYSKSRYRDRDGWVATMITGHFYVPENQVVEFQFLQRPSDDQVCFALLDDEPILGGKMNAAGIVSTKIVQLQKGIHKLTIYANDHARQSSVKLGYVKDDGSTEPIPADWFDPDKSKQLQDYMRPKGKITKTAEGFTAVLDTKERYRKFRWEFEDFSGNQVEVKSISATNPQGKKILPVKEDLSTGKNNQTLEIAPDDTITVTYNDERRLNEEKAILSDKLSSAFTDAKVSFQYEDVTVNEDGDYVSKFTDAVRVRKGDTVHVLVSDPDEDMNEEQETIMVEISTSSGEKMQMKLLEGENFGRGTFREVLKFGDVTDAAKNTVKIIPGDRIMLRYLDKENNKPGIPVHRTASLMNSETNAARFQIYAAKLRMIEDRSAAAQLKIRQMRDKGDKRKDIKIMKEVIEGERIEISRKKAAPEVLTVNGKTPLMFEFVCPDVAKHSGSTVNVEVLTQTEANAAKAENRDAAPLIVKCALTPLGGLARNKGYQVRLSGSTASSKDAVENGVFAGIVRLQLGSYGDEINDIVANNDSFNLLNIDENTDTEAFRIPTVLVSGSEKITLTYRGDDGKEIAKQTVQLRSNGEIGLFDKNYLTENKAVHLGQSFFVRVYDPDRDQTDNRDEVTVSVKAASGDTVQMKLEETLQHSGIFTGALKCELKPAPLAGQTAPQKLENNVLWTTFGDKVDFSYTDVMPLEGDKSLELKTEGEVIIGSDGELAIFTKKFKDPEMAVKTNFLMAEALFEMAKSHRAMKDEEKKALAQEEIAKGKRVLEEALRDYPNTTLKAQGEFLLANLAQQLENYNDAITLYSAVLSRYPDSEYAVKSQYEKAICLEKLKQFVPACEEYVKLTYLYPNDKLAANAKLRLANHYYKQKNYKTAMSIFRKFAQNHPDHQLASRGMMLAGYSATKYEEQKVKEAEKLKGKYNPDYTAAIDIFQELIEKFPDDKQMKPEAMYWLGDLYFKKRGKEDQAKSYRMLQNLIWEYPETRWAKLARGRLAERQD